MSGYIFPTIRSISSAPAKTAYLIASGDLRLSANLAGWTAQASVEEAVGAAFAELGWTIVRGHSFDPEKGHGFLDSQRAGLEAFKTIPADAPDPKAAYAFLNFMLRPAVIAQASNFTKYANANAAATPLVEPSVRNDPAAYPPPELARKLFVTTTKDQALLREVNRQWTRVLTGQ